LGLDEFVLERFERLVIQLELDLERAIRHPLALTEQVYHLIQDGIQVHVEPSNLSGGAVGPMMGHDQVREDIGYRYHNWRGKESRK
jgi:hypothetical protein